MELTPWHWLGLGAALVVAEALLPGAYVLWAGLAAIATGLITLALPLDWQMAVLLFACLTVISALIGRKVYARKITTDRPLLNDRSAQLVGTTHVLDQNLYGGHGRMRLGDSSWSVRGPDLLAGTVVRIRAVDGNTLDIEKAD